MYQINFWLENWIYQDNLDFFREQFLSIIMITVIRWYRNIFLPLHFFPAFIYFHRKYNKKFPEGLQIDLFFLVSLCHWDRPKQWIHHPLFNFFIPRPYVQLQLFARDRTSRVAHVSVYTCYDIHSDGPIVYMLSVIVLLWID